MTMCTRCRRNLLAGERFRLWQGGAGQRSARPVCGLCETAARREGWVQTVGEAGREGAVGLRAVVRLVA